MLPRRKAKPERRSSRWRSPAHRAWIRGFHCCICDSATAVECAHVRIGSGAGMGEKPDDWRTVPLCHECHAIQHKDGERTFWALWGAQAQNNIEALIDAFCKASPKAREIREARNG